MTGEPPPQDPWGDVVSQVANALTDMDLQDGPLRAALLDGLRSALGRVEGPALDLDAPPPEVVLVPGGRAEGTARAERPRPDLRVADDPTEEAVPEVHTQVRVVRVGTDDLDPDEPDWLAAPITHEGRIRLGEPTTTGGWQTVLRAELARPYRLSCDRGAMEIFLDGEPAERLACGQTVDLEARLIRVRSAGAMGADGSYVRL